MMTKRIVAPSAESERISGQSSESESSQPGSPGVAQITSPSPEVPLIDNVLEKRHDDRRYAHHSRPQYSRFRVVDRY